MLLKDTRSRVRAKTQGRRRSASCIVREKLWKIRAEAWMKGRGRAPTASRGTGDLKQTGEKINRETLVHSISTRRFRRKQRCKQESATYVNPQQQRGRVKVLVYLKLIQSPHPTVVGLQKNRQVCSGVDPQKHKCSMMLSSWIAEAIG